MATVSETGSETRTEMRGERCIEVHGTEVWLQGEGDEVILMLHGWPDTRALWDGTVAALQDRCTCARLTLPLKSGVLSPC